MFQTFDETADTGAVAERVSELRRLLKVQKVDAFLVPRGDEFGGEYVPAGAERLKWLTAFSGSAGLAIVALDDAALFVDGRYTVQVRQQTDLDIFTIKQIPTTSYEDWLTSSLDAGAVVAYDPWLHSISEVDRLSAKLKDAGMRLKPLSRNPVDRLWGKAQPAGPSGAVAVHPVELAGDSAANKIAAVQTTLATAGEDAVVLTLTDSIAWLFNLRGADVPHTPVVLAFAIVPRRG